MYLSNLPPGTTDADIERHARGCRRCEECAHSSVEFNHISDWDEGVATCVGTCEECGAEMKGKGRRREPDGPVEDIEWEVESCNHDETADDYADRAYDESRELDL